MTLKYQNKKVTQCTLMYAVCDRCKNDLYVEEGKLEDGGIFRHSFSWQNPKYPCGDMVAVLCEKCIVDVFSFAEFTQDQY